MEEGRTDHSWEQRVGRRTLRPRVVLQIAAIAAVIVFAYRERHLFTGFGSAMSSIRWYWVVPAFAAELASIVPLAEAQLIILRAGGVEAGRLEMNLVTLASNAVSMSVPAGVAVAEGYTYSRYRRLGASRAVAAWSELASGALAFAALAAVALAGAVLAGGPAHGPVLAALSVVAAGSFTAAALFRPPHTLIGGIEWIEGSVGRQPRSWPFGTVLLGPLHANHGNVDQVFGDEPHLEFVRPQHVAHQQVVGPVVSALSGLPDPLADLLDDDLVSFQETAQHRGDLLHAVRRSRDGGDLRHVARIRDGHAAEGLHPLRHQVDERELLAGVLVQQEMQLVEGRPAHHPVMLLVQVVQDDRVRIDLVQDLTALQAGVVPEGDRQQA